MMRQIHFSKNTFCSFSNHETDHQFDIIVTGDPTSAITPEVIQLAKENKVIRLKKEKGIETNVENINVSDLVFRVMMSSHIPVAAPKPVKVKGKNSSQLIKEIDPELDSELFECQTQDEIINEIKMKVNFPPFQHYRISESNELLLIGKSHWKGDLSNGSFCKTHGTITDELGRMFIKLCERFSMLGNWRNYTYVDEMRGTALLQLSQVGLQFDESKGSNPFSYYTAVLKNSFRKILNNEKQNQELRDDILELNGLTPSFARQERWNSNV